MRRGTTWKEFGDVREFSGMNVGQDGLKQKRYSYQ